MVEAERWVQEIGAAGAFEVSAKDGTGVNELFKEIAAKMQD